MTGRPWVLVAGAGQVGTFAAAALAEADCRVSAVDCRPAPGFFARFGPRDAADLTEVDLTDHRKISRILEDHPYDAVVLTAGIVGARCDEKPDLAFRVNVEASELLAEAALAAGIRRFVFVSSLAVYGGSLGGPVPVHAELRPTSVYGRTKAAAESRLIGLVQRGLDLRILRPCGIYGPLRLGTGSTSARRMEELLLRVARCGRLAIRAPENSAEEYLYVKDAGRAVARAVLVELPATRAGWVFNVGWGSAVSITELVQAVRRAIPGKEVTLELTPWEEGAARPPLDVSETDRRLGFQPRWSLADGLRDYLAEAGFAA